MTEAVTGFAVVDKPAGMTSHDVVARVRRLAHTRKVGHAGTLDPMATGVLVLAIGRITRLLTYVTGCDKSYAATVRLGATTVTDDAEGEITATTDASAVEPAAIAAGLAAMVGDIHQVPSAVSAIKVAGRRSYQRVRAGEAVELAARPVTIHTLRMGQLRHEAGFCDVDITVDCSSGTYVRAIARDLGAALGVGGHLTALRRTAVGGFGVDEAVPLAELAERDTPVTHSTRRTVDRLMPVREVDAERARVLGHGGRLSTVGWQGPYAVVDPAGAVIAVVAESGGAARPQVVLAED